MLLFSNCARPSQISDLLIIDFQVWGSSLPQSTGGQYSHVFQISTSDATFKIPVTSLTSSQPYIGASFSKYQTPALFKSNLNRSEVQVGSVVMAAQVRPGFVYDSNRIVILAV